MKNIIHQMVFKRLVALFIAILTLGCQGLSTENTAETINFEIDKPDKIYVDQKVLIKIYPKEKEFHLVKAFFDCEDLGSVNIDTLNKSILGCKKELFVKDDTLLIQFTPTKKGYENFHEIKTLLMNSEGKYYTKDTTFSYYVD